MSDVNKLLASLRQKSTEIEQYAASLRQNRLTDMTALKNDVASLCHSIGKAEIKDAQEKQVLESEMLGMISRLDELEAELKLYKQRKTEERDTGWTS